MPTTPEERRKLDKTGKLRETGFYHSFRLPDGTEIEGSLPLDYLERRFSRFPLPRDLTGKTVLDIGAWDGWFTFEAERRGASVTAIDAVEVPNFHAMHARLNSRADYRVLDIYELKDAGLGPFDYVFFLGVLYHVKHPLLALEIVCAATREICIVDSFVTDADTWREHQGQIPTLEFYETDELGGHMDNWFAPSVAALMGMCRAAGFARVELLSASAERAVVACYRQWAPVARTTEAAPVLQAVVNNANGGINFSSRRDEYLAWYFRVTAEELQRTDVLLEVDGFGVPTLFVKPAPDGLWMATSRVPPGLSAGWKTASLRLKHSQRSDARRIAIDLPLTATGPLSLRDASDGHTWERNTLHLSGDRVISLWVRGLPENVDCATVRVEADRHPLQTIFVGDSDAQGWRQVNARLDAPAEPGVVKLSARFLDVRSEEADVRLALP